MTLLCNTLYGFIQEYSFSFLFIPFESRQTDVHRWAISGLNSRFSSELSKLLFSTTLWLRATKTSLTAGGLLAETGKRLLCHWRKKRRWDMKEQIQICMLVVF